MASSGRSKSKGETSSSGERLHKFLASSGAGSRRECETFIEQGRVSVNGKVVTKLGTKVDPVKDRVLFDGEPVKAQDRVYYLLNKPAGYICTNSDERGRPRVVDLVRDPRHRIYTVGRLDADSRGLILLTNDGDIANLICHPRYRIEKLYQVVVRGRVDRRLATKLEAGVWLAEGKASPAKVVPISYDTRRDETALSVTLFEGRNREIRRTFAKVGLKVKRLVRTSLGPIQLGDLPEGHFRKLTEKDLAFAYDAEKLYLANKELWDAELPRQRSHKPRPGGKRPAHGAAPGRPGAHGGGRQGQRTGNGGARPKGPRVRFGGNGERPARSGGLGVRRPQSPRGTGSDGPPRRRTYE
ncbi:MAG: rRNA pseudouridine synthase [Planctomycetes bacterium]|nr:rRNA pseudouridine synthase [Planctomycetota bacterium]MCB9828684.1 rRNA pseudouridine synthase [Planctomycetota bacterium]MCB9901048.1 rRNA pseudouridine synthase [Planctomycetota bacterium]